MPLYSKAMKWLLAAPFLLCGPAALMYGFGIVTGRLPSLPPGSMYHGSDGSWFGDILHGLIMAAIILTPILALLTLYLTALFSVEDRPHRLGYFVKGVVAAGLQVGCGGALVWVTAWLLD